MYKGTIRIKILKSHDEAIRRQNDTIIEFPTKMQQKRVHIYLIMNESWLFK